MMTGNFWLDWALMAVSLANVILLTWLGLMVLLNAERRRWGIWLIGGGILMGGGFFVCHTAILGIGPGLVSRGLEWWWRTGWVPLVSLPLIWYLLMLWYTGFAEDWPLHRSSQPPNQLRQRHLPWLLGLSLLFVSLVSLLLFASPLPTFVEVTQLQLTTPFDVAGMPFLLLIFPIYILLCIGLSLDALRHPMPSGRMMGDQARRRAHPWLTAAATLLLLVSLLVGGVILWVMFNAQPFVGASPYPALGATLAWLDLLISLLIAVAVYLVGQAIVAYEIFTGKTLPRGELRRHWWNVVILAVGFGIVVGWSFAFPVRPLYSLLLATLLMTFFYALLSWRSYTRREEYIRQLRPFLGSQHLYERLLQIPTTGNHIEEVAPSPAMWPPAPSEIDITPPFYALCKDVLGVRLAYLMALGPLAPLVGPPLVYPQPQSAHFPWLASLLPALHKPDTICLPLEPEKNGGLLWAVPLWSERGLIGLFLLGSKRDNGLYTQEEIEIARASGERLIDTRASAEIARSLMTLQRQRLTESQLLDRRTRRVLHDDILPQVHTALLTLSSHTPTAIPEVTSLLMTVHHQLANLLREMPARSAPTLVGLDLISALRQLLADELPEAFDHVGWQIEPGGEQRLQALPPLTLEVLFYAARETVRNAARYGRGVDGVRPLHLQIVLKDNDGLCLQIEDDGVGLQIRPDESQGSRQGLALHSTMLAVVGGTLTIASVAEKSTCVTLQLPAGG
ncbi:hypothetical protein BH10CHL1_BH10CHL1_10560 [soil metagenome]